ncbi:mRNA capping enzyme-domain-containing protein [Sparassis latifolia]
MSKLKPSPKPSSPSKPPEVLPTSPAPSKLPYAPTRRRTPAGSVLIPLSPAELARYRNYSGGVGTLILRKRKRDDDDRDGTGNGERARKRPNDGDAGEDRPDGDSVPKRRRTGDVGLVVEHYNSRPDVGVTQRKDSPIIGLKSFNNWVKSVLITRFAHPVLAASPVASGGPGRGRVLDIGCGKGGDLTKWAKAKVREYVGVDIAAISVEQAAARHAGLRAPRFTASFFPLDCYTHALSAALPPAVLRPFDVVSLQFCMHYAFESERKVRQMLENVAGALRPGGVFIGTIPDSEQLLAQLDALPPNVEELTWGNSVYKIRFEDRAQHPLFGHRYWFFLRDAVDDVPEYVVHWDNFVQLAEEYGLQQMYRKEFHDVFEEHHEHAEFGPLLERMHVVDANGESQMDEDQWEAANIYVAFAFTKR